LIHLTRNRFGVIVLVVVSVLLLTSFVPAQGDITYGRWRDINPTQYTVDVDGTLRGVYVRNGGSGGIGAGDGWAVGGDSGNPIISHYDGFSWEVEPTIVAGAEYNAAHFCTAPGAPGVGLCSPNGDGSDGWIVGSGPSGAVALYWDGSALTQVSTGLATYSASNLTSVFMVCHSAPYGSGCPGALASGLTYAAGSTGAGQGIILAFNGNPKASGGWTQQFVTSTTTQFNSIYMYIDQSGNLAGFAVGNGGVIAQYSSGGWTALTPLGVTNDLLGVFVDRGNPADVWAVGRSGLIAHYFSGIWGAPTFPLGTSNDLVSIFLTSTSEGWIVGAHSTISHSTNLGSGNVWSPLTSPIQTGTGSGIDLLSVSFPSGGNGWAVGSQGVILHTENSNCGPVPGPCWGGSSSITQSSQLTSVFEKSSNDAWAGGLFDTASGNPTLLHWDGNKWHRVTVSGGYGVPNPDIYGIYMLSSSEGWAVGGNTASPAPAALKWDGNSWTSMPVAACACTLRSVYMISGGTGGDGWAVGTLGLIYRYQSGSWVQFTTAPSGQDLNSVFISNAGNNLNAGWAVGNLGTLLKLSITNGVPSWNTFGIPGITTQNLYGVFFTDSNHGWIVGDSATIVSTTDGGNTWSGGTGQVINAPSGTVLKSVYIDTYGTGSGNGDGWAVGQDGSTPPNAVFAHWNGQSWTAVSVDPSLRASVTPFGLGLTSVYLTSPVDGFAVGAGVAGASTPLAGIFHLDPPNPPIYQGGVTTATGGGGGGGGGSTGTATTTSSAASTATSGASSATQVITSTATVTSSSVATGVLTSTATAQTTSLSVNTLVLPGIPGFPWESILLGAIIGLTVLAIARRHRAGRASKA
jgi:photosystem II stability/assembly factor-like uncharacterized protein